MKRYKCLFCVFAGLAVLLSDVMCAGIRYGVYSAPASTAFLLAVPYAVGIVICALLAWCFHRKYRSA